MWGLFALVWLVIAAGVVLPLYPSDVTAPRWAADQALPAATTRLVVTGGADVLPAALVVEDAFGLSVILLVQPPAAASSASPPLAPTLPAI